MPPLSSVQIFAFIMVKLFSRTAVLCLHPQQQYMGSHSSASYQHLETLDFFTLLSV